MDSNFVISISFLVGANILNRLLYLSICLANSPFPPDIKIFFII